LKDFIFDNSGQTLKDFIFDNDGVEYVSGAFGDFSILRKENTKRVKFETSACGQIFAPTGI